MTIRESELAQGGELYERGSRLGRWAALAASYAFRLDDLLATLGGRRARRPGEPSCGGIDCAGVASSGQLPSDVRPVFHSPADER